jgi:hypothetical protein
MSCAQNCAARLGMFVLGPLHGLGSASMTRRDEDSPNHEWVSVSRSVFPELSVETLESTSAREVGYMTYDVRVDWGPLQ